MIATESMISSDSEDEVDESAESQVSKLKKQANKKCDLSHKKKLKELLMCLIE